MTTTAPESNYERLAALNLAVADETQLPGFFGTITLRCRSDSVNLDRVKSGLVNLCADHRLDVPIGRILAVTIGNRAVTANAEIAVTDNGQKYLDELDQGLRLGVSPGFIINEVEPDENSDGLDIIVTAWEPYEISLTAGPRNPKSRIIGRFAMNVQTLEQGQLVNTDDVDGFALSAGRRALDSGKITRHKAAKLRVFYRAYDRAIENGLTRAAAIETAKSEAGF